MSDTQPPLPALDPIRLPSWLPRIGRYLAAFLLVWAVGTVVGGIVDGVEGLNTAAIIGTAAGTLGLAYFTLTLAVTTVDVVRSSQRLEAISQRQLEIGRAEVAYGHEEALAATQAAAEALRSRVDSVAPLVDLRVEIPNPPAARHRGLADAQWVTLGRGGPVQPTPPVGAAEFNVSLRIEIRNYGRTPAQVRFTHVGVALADAPPLIRVEPDPSALQAFWAPLRIPDFTAAQEGREISYDATIEGPLTGATIDELRWTGEVKLFRDAAGTLEEPMLRQIDYRVTRSYRETATEESATG
jgi:hypothetical protein